MSDVLRDAAGHTIPRDAAIREAVAVIVRQGDERMFVQAAVEDMTDDEILEWLIEPDGKGLFAKGVPYVVGLTE